MCPIVLSAIPWKLRTAAVAFLMALGLLLAAMSDATPSRTTVVTTACTDSSTSRCPTVCDFDGDCDITVDDLSHVAGQWHQTVIPLNTRYDLNGDGDIDVVDIALTTVHLGDPCSGGIEFTYVPPYGSYDDLLGQARCVEPADYKVAVYIYVSGWWTKPYWASPLTSIQPDGSWTADITTGGIDQLATRIAAFLVPNEYDPPLMGGGQTLPAELFGNAIAWVTVEREAVFRTIEFSGYTWKVKASETPAGPGPNYFSDRAEDVWVDAEGRLHLRIVQRAGKWYSTEVFTEAPLGYGQYVFHLASRVDQLDKNIVLGLFTWDDTAPEHNYREIDIEFSRWGDAGNDNAQFVVQPWNNPGNMHRFNVDLQADESTHGFDWRADRVFFQSMQGRQSFPGPVDSEIEAWTYTGADIPPAGPGNARINLWLLNGNPPSDGVEAEVIIEAFEFVPFNTTTSDGPYGVVQDLAYDPSEDLETIVDLMAQAGVQYVRMDFRWYLIEPENDVWDFEAHDRIVQTLENRGVQVVGLLNDVPTWANGQSGPWSGTHPPENVEDWSDFVLHVVDHYQSRITYWELWNEENIYPYFQPTPNADLYVPLLKAGYQAAKQANPEAVVLLGSLAGNGVNMGWELSESQNFLQKIYDSGGKGYFDIVGIHPYVHPITSTHGLPAGIEGLQSAVEATRAVILANGDDKPIWITEVGWSTAPDAWGQPTVSEIEVAGWLRTVYTGLSDLGVDKMFWYNLRDSGPDRTNVEHNFGLVRNDRVPKPAYWQYKALAVSAENAYSHLYAVMDKYAAGDTLRLLDSYEPTATWDDGDTAWVYDNALVMLALMARGTDEDWARAKVLADSLIYAQSHDPDFNDGRLRDAYHASAFIGQDGKAQVAAPGSGVGNTAFATLSLLRYWEVKGGGAYLEAATRLGQWIYDHTYDTRGPGGYIGGYAGSPPNQTKHQWKATEHNIDVYVAFMKLYEATGDSKWLRRALHAKNFVRAMWNEAGGHFWTGTLNDGASINPSPIPEDTQSWGLMALSEVDRYGAGITWAENNPSTGSGHGLLVDPCPGCEACKGFRFSDQGAGCWWEGTAHMTIAFQIKSEGEKASEFLEVLHKIQSTVPNNNGQGIVSACPSGADSGYGGIYPNALHIGATAWYLFAERHHNPFWRIGTDEPIPYAGLYDALLETMARDTWNYLSSDWATDNHLPWSWRSPQMPDGDYANPTEIGFYMLSHIGAYELQRDWSPSWAEVEAAVGATLDQLEAWQSGTQAYQPHGPNAYNNSVFYQAYWINENPPVVGAGSYDHQVPSIDNAWLAASLITIREYAEANGKTTLAQKADGVLRDMDFTIWYHPDKHRFNWGAPNDPPGGGLADYYSNENRIINFVARALGQLSEEEFQASLAALKQSSGTYDGGTSDPSDDITVGKVNWDGSYFTYPAPALFIREMEAAYGKETIDKATEAQIAYAQDQGHPVWGISDAFDVEDGGYVERGAPPRSSDDPLDDEDDGLITPHATALALITGHAHEAIDNLQTLQDRYPALYDADYGFKDSVNVNSDKISYRFSALGQEWIFLSLMNYLGDGVIWRYFYQDEGVQRAHEEMYRDLDSFSISSEAHDQLTLALTYNSEEGEYLVVWEDRRNAEGQSYEIRGRRVSGDGTLVGDEFVISAAQYPQKWPAVTYNAQDNTYLAVWVRWRSIHNTREDWEWDIYGQALGSDGALINDNFAIATADRRKRSPAVAYCSSAGQYLVVWDDIGFVQGQLVSGEGALLDNRTTPEDESDSGVSFRASTAGSTQVHPDVVYNGQDREFFVVWRDSRHAGLNYNDDVYGQRVSCTGELLIEGDIPISTQQVVDPNQTDPYIAPNGQNGPAIAHNATANEYLVVWHDGRNDPDGDESGLDIYGQRVSAAGDLLDNPSTALRPSSGQGSGRRPRTLEDETDPAVNFAISRAAGKQWLPDIAHDSVTNRYLVVWTDWRNGDADSDIYGQQVSGTGELVGEEFVIEDAGGNQGNLWFGWDSEEGGGLAVANNSRSQEFLAVWTDCRNADTTGCDIYGQRYELLPFKVFLPGVRRTGP